VTGLCILPLVEVFGRTLAQLVDTAVEHWVSHIDKPASHEEIWSRKGVLTILVSYPAPGMKMTLVFHILFVTMADGYERKRLLESRLVLATV